MKLFKIKILPDNVTVEVEEGESLLHACHKAGVILDSPCGGRGTCGKCLVTVISHDENKSVLSCTVAVHSDMTIEIPSSSRMTKQQVMLEGSKTVGDVVGKRFPLNNPLCKKIKLKIDKPTLFDAMNDRDRIKLALSKKGYDEVYIPLEVLQRMSALLRQYDFDVSLTLAYGVSKWSVIDIEGADAKNAYALAVDIGTTTVAAYLVDMDEGIVLDKAGTYNHQSIYGSDVISRIVYADENKDGLKELQKAVVSSINEVIDLMLLRNSLEPSDIKAITSAGNTVMTQMFLNINCTYLRLEPYVPAAVEFPPLRAYDLGLHTHQDAIVLVAPSVASYVGGDISAGVLYSKMYEAEPLTLFIDIGTNGEMVLGNNEWLMTCSCSAGPAFEGSGLSCGMRAMDGAITSLKIDPQSMEPTIETINSASPRGICGSGMIYALAEMRQKGVIDRTGNFADSVIAKRIRKKDDGDEYVLAYKGEYGAKKDICITENDIKNILRAKAAIFAGIRIMMSQMELDFDCLDKVVIAGGFGSFLNVKDAISIGMLPDLPLDKYEYVGNSSVQGALEVLLDIDRKKKEIEIARAMTYLELSIGNQFMEEFVQAMFIPHTDMSLFPSLN